MAAYINDERSPQLNSTDMENVPVWRDSTADPTFDNYILGSNNGAAEMGTTAGAAGAGAGIRQSFNPRASMNRNTISSNVHQDINVEALGTDEAAGGAATGAAYTGRKVVWPGALFLTLVTLGALACMAYFGVQEYKEAQDEVAASSSSSSSKHTYSSPVEVEPDLVCQLPNYVTSDGKIYAEADNGTSTEVVITGINWSGMENSEGVPGGLAYGQATVGNITKLMANQGINAVRLPLNAEMILNGGTPNLTYYLDDYSSPELNVTTYMGMIKAVVKSLAKQQIAVLLDIHKLDPTYSDGVGESIWYTDDFSVQDLEDTFTMLTDELCSDNYYNIIGVDIKNEPSDGCWPEDNDDSYCDSDLNWPQAAATFGDVILEGCSNWLIFVEGVYGKSNTIEVDGTTFTYNDWEGSSLENASSNPVSLSVDNKLVYAPHFYSPSVYPSSYFFESSDVDDNTFTEYDNDDDGNTTLQDIVYKVLDNAFGSTMNDTGVPTLYGEFGGIYGEAEDLTYKTSSRVIEDLISYADAYGMAGGFAWSLNPDSAYSFNDEYEEDGFTYGLYKTSEWVEYHSDYSTTLQKLKGTGVIPCYETVSSSSGSSSSSSDTVGN